MIQWDQTFTWRLHNAFDNFICMQYLGFTGKSDVEVYEHDIVNYHTGYAKSDTVNLVVYTGIIIWKNYGWHLKAYVADQNKMVEFNLNGNYWFGSFKRDNFEVTGNIHENPEFFTPQWNAAIERSEQARLARMEYMELFKEAGLPDTTGERRVEINKRQNELRKTWDL